MQIKAINTDEVRFEFGEKDELLHLHVHPRKISPTSFIELPAKLDPIIEKEFGEKVEDITDKIKKAYDDIKVSARTSNILSIQKIADVYDFNKIQRQFTDIGQLSDKPSAPILQNISWSYTIPGAEGVDEKMLRIADELQGVLT
jgi:hypothetical protein